ncbi:hypothetical protein [Mycolicibacterium hippocampi]|uniref:Acetoacetate decarboxylase n=1 Tax=Mycolicibacterium hippocampi TaxID=659824 RepID=A0A7I9ZHE0_9MYCO|nr:hypothetical protein [Mycolicibacterium hippocampi]GFH00440.1 hypothetical protein MHIP_09230 [Mycolicibacterium hippocampi]
MSVEIVDGPDVVPLPREIIKDARMMIVGYRPADPAAARRALPKELEPHPDGIVLLNLWTAVDPGLSSGMGTYGRLSCGYIAPEVSGYDTRTSDGETTGHGRFFAHHWLESEGMRFFAEASCGNRADIGWVEQTEPRPGELVQELYVDGKVVVRTTSRVGTEKLATVGGHLNYFTNFAGPEDREQIARVAVPFVADVRDAQVTSIEWLFDAAHPAAALAPGSDPHIASVLYGDVTWAPFTVAEIL